VTAGAFFMRDNHRKICYSGRLAGFVTNFILYRYGVHRRCCALCLQFDLVFAIKYGTRHYRCSMWLWLGLFASGVANGTVNRMLALLRPILIRSSVDWEWLPVVPKVRLLKESIRRVRYLYLTKSQAESLLLQLPSHLAEMTAFSLATGLRKSNVIGLCLSQVDLARRLAWIHPDQSKTRKAIAVPLNVDALRVIALQRGKHSIRVFSYKGDPVSHVTTSAWYRALERCGIDDFRWHDLRHTWASWHVQNGTPLNVLQELGGWESAKMV